jgi:hypothetical protein
LTDLTDESAQEFHHRSHLRESSVGKEKLDDHTLRGLVDDDLCDELDRTGDDIDSLPAIATLQATEQREINEEEVKQHDDDPGDIFGSL